MATMKKNDSMQVGVEVLNYREYKPKRGTKTNLLGFATVSINGVAFSGVRHMTGRNGNWISFPSEAVDNQYYPTVWLNLGDKTVNSQGYNAVLEAIEAYINED